MSSTVRYYRYDDAGAPTITGQVGSLTTLLRTVLVGTAGIAYGSTPSAGWTEEFIGTGTNTAVFRNNQSEDGCGCYVLVNDNAPGAGGAREARINVYATMSNISTGTNGTTTTYFRKSSTADSTTRRWLVIADGRTAWVYSFLTGDGTNYGQDNSPHGFGDFESTLPTASVNRYFVMGRSVENDASQGGTIPCMNGGGGFSAAMQMADPTGVGAPVQTRPNYTIYSAGYGYGSAYMPVDVNGDQVLEKMPAAVNSANLHFGWLRGLYLPLYTLNGAAAGAYVPGSSSLVVMKGKSAATNSVAQYFAVALDSVGPW